MAEPVNRREFWKKGLLRMLYAAGILGMAYPVMSFITFKKTRKRAVVFQPGEQNETVMYREGVYLITTEHEPYALSARCTHLGCTINYDAVTRKFRCPCHGSVFDVSGKWVSGPAGKDLVTVPLHRTESGEAVAVLTL